MKPRPTPIPSLLAALALLVTLAGGCASNYGPASPDYYPQFCAPNITLDSVHTINLQQKEAAQRSCE
jgi:hypothetical protein